MLNYVKKGLTIASLKREFEAAFNDGNNPNLDKMDQIVSHDLWQKEKRSNNSLGDMETPAFEYIASKVSNFIKHDYIENFAAIDSYMNRPLWKNYTFSDQSLKLTLETNVLNYMVSQANSLLENQDNLDPRELEPYINHPLWKQNSFLVQVRQVETKLEKFFEQVIKDLQSNNQNTIALSRIKLWRAVVKDEIFKQKIDQMYNDCCQRRENFHQKVLDKIEQIKNFIKKGRFDDARDILNLILKQAARKDEVQEINNFFMLKEKQFANQLNEMKDLIRQDSLLTAQNLFAEFQTQYPESSKLLSLQEDLEKKIIKYLIAQTKEWESNSGIEIACLWLEDQCCEKYSQIVSINALIKSQPKIYTLFENFVTQSFNKVYEHLANMNFDVCKNKIEQISKYDQTHVWKENFSSSLKKITDNINIYHKALETKDLKTALVALNTLETSTIKYKFDPLCSLLTEKNRLENIAEKWNQILAKTPFSKEEINSHIYQLNSIIESDLQEYGKKAKQLKTKLHDKLKRMKIEQIMQQAETAQMHAQYNEAIDYLKQIFEIDQDDKIKEKIRKIETTIAKEQEQLENGVAAQKNGYLNKALNLIIPLCTMTSVQDRSKQLKQEIINDIKKIDYRALQAWNQALAPHTHKPDTDRSEKYLYKLDKTKFEELMNEIKKLFYANKESNLLKGYVSALLKEVSIRGNIEKIIKDEQNIEKAGSKALISDFGRISEQIKKFLNDYPGYPVLVEKFEYWNLKIKESLLADYKHHLESKEFYTALSIEDMWHKYLDLDMSHEIIALLGDKFKFLDIKELVNKAGKKAMSAESYYRMSNYHKADQILQSAFKICVDHPDALDLQNRLKEWKQGIGWLRDIEKQIELYDKDQNTKLDFTLELLENLQKSSVQFKELKELDLRWNTLHEYKQELAKRLWSSGIAGKFLLSIIPGKRFLLFVQDKLFFGSPKDEQADIKAGGIKKDHCCIQKTDKGFQVIKNQGKCVVNSFPIDFHDICKGDEVKFGNFKLDVKASEKSLVMKMKSSNSIDGSLQGIVMMGNNLSIGNTKESDIYIPYLNSVYNLYKRDNGFFIITKNQDTKQVILGKNFQHDKLEICLSMELGN